ncbi:MAG: GGDEF domain-containing protein [Xylophilus ampelinus]
MRPILKHLIEITANRDQTRLEVSVVSALANLVGATRVRKLETVADGDRTLLRATELLDGHGRAVAADSSPAQRPEPESFDDYPELLACLESQASSAERECGDGRYLLWMPVRIDGRMSSCLEVTTPKRYGESTQAVVLGIFEVYCNYQSLLDYSERDALTGLFNRKTFDDQFPRYQTEAAAPEPEPGRDLAAHEGKLGLFTLDEDTCRPIAEFGEDPPPDRDDPEQEVQSQWLAVVDIDHFKKVNDRFGHVYGDEVLILVSNILKASFRGNDRIFRFGGEEFVVLLRQVPLRTARIIFERFRRNVEQYAFPQVGQVTISLGFAKTDAGTPVEILGRADQALYYAKEHGRNRICYYEELVRAGRLQSGVAHQDIEFF